MDIQPLQRNRLSMSMCLLWLGFCVSGLQASPEQEAAEMVDRVRQGMPYPPLSEDRLRRLTQDLSENEAFDRINAVIELLKRPEQAQRALPMMKAALGREYGMLGEPKIAALLKQAIKIIEAGGWDETEPDDTPSDSAFVAEQLMQQIQSLRSGDTDRQLAAIAALRVMRELAEPARADLQKLADREALRTAVAGALKQMDGELWFLTESDRFEFEDLKVDQVAARLAVLMGRLVDQLGSSKVPDRMKAIRALSRSGAVAEISIPKLQALATEDGSSIVRQAAKVAAQKIESALASTQRWRQAQKTKK